MAVNGFTAGSACVIRFWSELQTVPLHLPGVARAVPARLALLPLNCSASLAVEFASKPQLVPLIVVLAPFTVIWFNARAQFGVSFFTSATATLFTVMLLAAPGITLA